MKVILLQDVARLGRKFEVAEVPDGHAQNYLIPRRLAEPASASRIAQLERQRESASAQREELRAQIEAFVASLGDAPLELSAEANAQGHLFKGIRAADIARAIAARAQLSIAQDAIDMRQPLKEVGEHTVTLTYDGARYDLPISVQAA